MLHIQRNIWFFAILAMIQWGCSKERINTPPNAILNVFPYAGDTTTIFTLDASKSSDNEDIREKLTVRWDWNNDGIWDTGFQSELKTLYRFSTKGMNCIRMELLDSGGLLAILIDSVRVFPIPVSGSMTDPRDGQLYRTVFLEGNWWMAESMRYGSVVPSDSAQNNNGTVEAYVYNNDLKNLEEYGGLYSWFEAMQYSEAEKSQGVCPPGWHIPSYDEWKSIAPSDVPYLFLNYYYGPGGPGGLNLTYGGYFNFLYETRNGGRLGYGFGGITSMAGYWTSSQREEKVEDYSGNVAYQRRNLSINLFNVLSESTFGIFDNTGLFVLGDRIHLRGNPAAYDRFSPYIVNETYAHFVRCIKNP
ncbi:MAG: hypothetical protein NTV01_21270 [Bacteroidia bacterium]|nr:hypothetical protein [Bacteroidia bacterium]